MVYGYVQDVQRKLTKTREDFLLSYYMNGKKNMNLTFPFHDLSLYSCDILLSTP